MSQFTIVEDVLDFTEVPKSGRERCLEPSKHATTASRHDLNEEQHRTVHELTSILISGHLPE